MSVTNTEAAPKNLAIRQARERRAGALIPGTVLLEVSHHCNLKCLHCFVEPYHHEPQSNELDTSEWVGVLEQLFEMGVWYVTFTGGEPLYRPDIFEIMNYAKERGLFFGLKTNGTLITEPVADRLKELGPTVVDVSLYGATREPYEYVTGVAGSYDRTIRAIKLLRERKIKVNIKSTMMRCNAGEHEEIENIAGELSTSYGADPLVLPKVGQPGSADHIRMDDVQLRAFIEKRNWRINDADVKKTDPEQRLICVAGRITCTVSPQGEVFPCVLWRIPLGDLKQQSFRDIWYGEAASNIRSIKVSDIQACANCEFLGYCYRCQGLAYLENGGISGPSSENCRLARAAKGVRDEREKETLRKPRYRDGRD